MPNLGQMLLRRAISSPLLYSGILAVNSRLGESHNWRPGLQHGHRREADELSFRVYGQEISGNLLRPHEKVAKSASGCTVVESGKHANFGTSSRSRTLLYSRKVPRALPKCIEVLTCLDFYLLTFF